MYKLGSFSSEFFVSTLPILTPGLLLGSFATTKETLDKLVAFMNRALHTVGRIRLHMRRGPIWRPGWGIMVPVRWFLPAAVYDPLRGSLYILTTSVSCCCCVHFSMLACGHYSVF